jgi:hypothetical protein
MPVTVFTLTAPELVSGMTRACNDVADGFKRMASVPPMVTDSAVEKSAPVMWTRVPTGPEEGVKEGPPAAGGGFEPESSPPQAESKTANPMSHTAGLSNLHP